jgi:hypothetical protein
MTITKVITAAIIAFSASASLASTKCDHRLSSGGLFASTAATTSNKAQAAKKVTVKTATVATKSGVR